MVLSIGAVRITNNFTSTKQFPVKILPRKVFIAALYLKQSIKAYLSSQHT